MLLAIRESWYLCQECAHHIALLVYIVREGDVGSSACFRHHSLFLRMQHLLRPCILHHETYLHPLVLLHQVGYAGTDVRLVTHTQEAWHPCLHHYLLLCYGSSVHQGVAHLLVVRQCHKLPCSDALWHSEFQRCHALRVCLYLWEEECCLSKVFSYFHLLLFCFTACYVKRTYGYILLHTPRCLVSHCHRFIYRF